MAIYRLQIESISRSDGHSSVGAAAYRAGERIRDDRTNEIHNHSRRKDVTHSEIMLPSDLSGSENMEWARNRASLWNAVENAEPRKNARVAREIQVNLPHELSPERRVALARSFSQEVADHYKVAVDLAVHEPRPSGDPRNHHAHLLMTTREVSAQGLGAKAGLELSTHERIRLGLPSGAREYTAIRERWAAVTNEALKEANIEARVDHRSLADQGVDREPKPHIPFAAYKIERAGQYSDVAESIRADYAARVQARLERQVTHEPNAAAPQHTNAATSMSADGLAPQRNVAPSVAADWSTSQRTVPTSVAAAGPTSQPALTPAPAADPPPKSLEEVRREARENWLKLRAASTQQPDQPTPIPDHSTHNQPAARHPAAAASPTPTRVPDNDQTL